MNPVLSYLKNLFAQKRVLGDGGDLENLAKADAQFSDLIDQGKVPGISVTVIRRGEVLLQKGYGHSDLERRIRVDPANTVFRIASVSKNIAATALAHMVVEGRIDLDASFYDYVPYYPGKKWDFTIRQLAAHTAGIRGYRGTEYGLNKPYSIKEGIVVFKDDGLLFEPGTDYFYNSYDWVLISLAMQEASGIPFEDYVKEKVLDPLGMNNTFPENVVSTSPSEGGANEPVAEPFDLTQDRLGRSYTKNRMGGFRKAIPVNNFYKLAGGGYLSTSGDIAIFGQALLEDRLFADEMAGEFLTAQTVNRTSTYYGLGWQVSEDAKGRKFFGHVGNGVGGYSNFFVYPEERMVFVVLINCTDPKVQEALDGIVDGLLNLDGNAVL